MTLSRVRASVVVIQNERILGFQAVDPTSKKEYFFLPGGMIEPHETATEAAARETLEETGYSIDVTTEGAVDKEYFFEWDGNNYDCFTIFYLGKLKSPFPVKKVIDAAYHKGVIWTPIAEIENTFGYSEAILESVRALIASAT